MKPSTFLERKLEPKNFKVIRTALLVITSLLFATSPVFAMNADELAGKLQESYDKTRDLSASFTQESFVKAMDMRKSGSGKLVIKKPGLLRYTYVEPEKQELIVRGEELIMYTPSTNQVVKKKLSRAVMDRTPSTFLAGLGKVTDSFAPRIPKAGEKDKQGRYLLELVPKGEKMGVEKVTLALDPKSFEIESFSFTETSGNTNTIELGGIKINKGVKDSAFDFKVPKGASVLAE
jgi:outer membrane lipoprotein carrier protein